MKKPSFYQSYVEHNYMNVILFVFKLRLLIMMVYLHRICFAAACLAVGKNTNVIPIQTGNYQVLDFRKYLNDE